MKTSVKTSKVKRSNLKQRIVKSIKNADLSSCKSLFKAFNEPVVIYGTVHYDELITYGHEVSV